jgi:prefoldin subunit 5
MSSQTQFKSRSEEIAFIKKRKAELEALIKKSKLELSKLDDEISTIRSKISKQEKSKEIKS